MADLSRPLPVVTGASTGIGLELARQCAENGFDLLIAADEPEIEAAADELPRTGANVDAIEADLATKEGVDPAAVAKNRFEAMMKGEGGVISGFRNKAAVAVTRVMSQERLAEQHRHMAAPGTAAPEKEHSR